MEGYLIENRRPMNFSIVEKSYKKALNEFLRSEKMLLWPDGIISIGDSFISPSDVLRYFDDMKLYGSVVPHKCQKGMFTISIVGDPYPLRNNMTVGWDSYPYKSRRDAEEALVFELFGILNNHLWK